jgi:hypothetical protein
VAPQAQADSGSPGGQPAGGAPKTGNESEPTGPLPKPQNGPTGLPQAQGVYPPELQHILQAAANSEDFVSPVTTAAGQMHPLSAAIALPSTNTLWGTTQPAAPAATPVPVVPKAEPVFLTPTQVSPPALPPGSSTWSAPQSETGSSGTAKASDEIRSPAADQFDMPLNEVGR